MSTCRHCGGKGYNFIGGIGPAPCRGGCDNGYVSDNELENCRIALQKANEVIDTVESHLSKVIRTKDYVFHSLNTDELNRAIYKINSYKNETEKNK